MDKNDETAPDVSGYLARPDRLYNNPLMNRALSLVLLYLCSWIVSAMPNMADKTDCKVG
jgi:hypothetical protein